MTGTLINVAAVILGGFLGCLFKKGIPEHISSALMKAEGLALSIIALNGVLTSMLYVDGESGRIKDSGGLLLLISLVLGCVIGEALGLDGRVNSFGMKIEKAVGTKGFSKGFVTASLIFCIGTMAVIGPMNEVLSGDRSILYIKSILDMITGMVLASVLGSGVIFAAVPVLIIQGAFALLSGVISPYITPEILKSLCMVGYSIVLCIGINFLFDVKIKTMNLMPALIVSVLYEAVMPKLTGLPFIGQFFLILHG